MEEPVKPSGKIAWAEHEEPTVFVQAREKSIEQPCSSNQLEKMELNEKIVDIDPECTKHMEEYKNSEGTYLFFGRCFGLTSDYHAILEITPGYWRTWFLLVSAFVGVAYSIGFHIYHGSYAKVMEPLAIVGMSSSCLLKWIFTTTKHRKILSLMFFIRKLCRLHLTGPRANIINDGLRITMGFLKYFHISVLMSLSIMLSIPLYSAVIKGVLLPIMPLEYPFVDQSTLQGFILVQILFIFLGVYGNFGTCMFGSGFVITICNYTILVNLVAEDFKDLDELWNNPTTTTIEYRYAYLTNICMKVQDMKNYLVTVKDIYQLKFTIYFFINWFAQVICMYEVMADGWIGGLTILLVISLEMFFSCLIGTRLTTEGENLRAAICKCNWHLYDIKSQRLISMLLDYSSRPLHVMLGTIGPLSVVTGVSITKSMYSMYTVIEKSM